MKSWIWLETKGIALTFCSIMWVCGCCLFFHSIKIIEALARVLLKFQLAKFCSPLTALSFLIVCNATSETLNSRSIFQGLFSVGPSLVASHVVLINLLFTSSFFMFVKRREKNILLLSCESRCKSDRVTMLQKGREEKWLLSLIDYHCFGIQKVQIETEFRYQQWQNRGM